MIVPFPKPRGTAAGPSPDDAAYRVRTPEDVLALAPIVLGFEPDESVVMLTLGAHRQFHARADLPARRTLTPDVARDLAELLLRPAREHGVSGVVLLFYGDDDRTQRVLRPLRRGCRSAGIRVVAALRTDGRRYYPLLAADRALREVGVPYDVTAHPFATRAVVEGRVVHPDRSAMAATLDPDPAARRAVAAALPPPGSRLPHSAAEQRAAGEWVAGLVADRAATGTVAPTADVARLVWLLQVDRLCHAAWVQMRCPVARRHVGFWSDVVRRTPDPLLAAPAALAGWAAWLAGDGALAWTAVDRCRAVDPDHAMAAVLAEVLSDAVPPEAGEPRFDWAAGLGPVGPEQRDRPDDAEPA